MRVVMNAPMPCKNLELVAWRMDLHHLLICEQLGDTIVQVRFLCVRMSGWRKGEKAYATGAHSTRFNCADAETKPNKNETKNKQTKMKNEKKK